MRDNAKHDYIMSTRWVGADRGDPPRTAVIGLDRHASARLMVNSGCPGKSDETAAARVGAPRATAQSDAIINQVAASRPDRGFGAKDVSGAFLKGEAGERGPAITPPSFQP